MLYLFCLSLIKDAAFLFRWIVDMEGAPGTLYEGEKFQLLFKFSSRYPFDSPQVSTKHSGPVFTCCFFNIVIKDMKGRSAAQIICSAVVQ